MTRVRESDVAALKRREIEIKAFAERHSSYFKGLASHFGRRLRGVPQVPIGEDDLVQLGLIALWESVERYRFRCPVCPRSAMTEGDFSNHTLRAHGTILLPSPPLFVFVHAEVGRAMEHEVRRYTRRARYTSELPGSRSEERGEKDFREVGAVPPSQHFAAELAELIARARAELDPLHQRALAYMALGIPARDLYVGRARALEVEKTLRGRWLSGGVA